jgi:ectoine hydroxylase-related dioxygenase (phytanoyl-CoA dioxygenase family)
VPHAAWHLDLPASDLLGPLPAIRAFAFLEPVRPHGGGTLYLAGSHQAVLDRARQGRRGEPLRSADMRAALKAEEPWLAALLQPGGEDRARRFMDFGGTLRGRPVRVEEMTGGPGDVIVMHPAMLHAGAQNGLDRPRMMLVETFYRENP